MQFIQQLKEDLRAEAEDEVESSRRQAAIEQLISEESTILYEDLRPSIYDALREKMEEIKGELPPRHPSGDDRGMGDPTN